MAVGSIFVRVLAIYFTVKVLRIDEFLENQRDRWRYFCRTYKPNNRYVVQLSEKDIDDRTLKMIEQRRLYYKFRGY